MLLQLNKAAAFYSNQNIPVLVGSLPHFDDAITWRRNKEALWPLTHIQVSDDVMMADWWHIGHTTGDVFGADGARGAVRLLQYFCALDQLRPATARVI